MSSHTKIVYFVLGILLISLSLNGWYFLRSPSTSLSAEDYSKRNLPFLSPRIFVNDQNDILVNFVPLRTTMRDYIYGAKEPVGFYFEYLPSGTSIGINEKENYVLASLLKVPVVMAVYHKIEKNELTMNQPLTIEEADIDLLFGDLGKKGSGTTLTIKEAIELALTRSDNTAKNVLLKVLSPADLGLIFDGLDIPQDAEEHGPVVNAKNYSSILRSLYLSSYLSKQSSNEILEIMTKSIFQDKLRAGVPKEIPVAHKIGVFVPESANQNKVFSDCGIVYPEKRPYILCIFVQGDEAVANIHISRLAKTVYEYVSSR